MFDVVQTVAHQNPAPGVMPAPTRVQFMLQPLVPFVIEMLMKSCAVVFLKRRIHAGFHGMETQEVTGKTVNGFNVRPLHLTHGLVAHCRQFFVGKARGFLKHPDRPDLVIVEFITGRPARGEFLHEPQTVPHPQLQFTGRLVGKGDGDDLR